MDFENPTRWAIRQHMRNFIIGLNGRPEGRAAKIRAEEHIGHWHMRISMAELQRAKMRILQYKIVQEVMKMRFDRDYSGRWTRHLKSYVQAVRDYDFMIDCSRRDSDPFYISSERVYDDVALQKAFVAVPNHQERWSKLDFDEATTWDDERLAIGFARSDVNIQHCRREYVARLLSALLGSAFLIVPMWVMMLHRTQTVCLVVTTVFVIIFGLTMTFVLKKSIDVLAASLAYAAVLVVFVGLAV